MHISKLDDNNSSSQKNIHEYILQLHRPAICAELEIISYAILLFPKVSLLEYRNRSRNRLSVDLPSRMLPQHTTVVTPPSNSSSSSAFSSSVIKSSSLSASLPNLNACSTAPSLLHRPVTNSGEMNGPHLEPVSPDMEDKSSGKQTNKYSHLVLQVCSAMQLCYGILHTLQAYIRY